MLDRRKRTIDHHEVGVRLVDGHADTFDLPLAEQRGRPNSADRQDEGIDHIEANGVGKALPFLKTRLGIFAKAAFLADIGQYDEGTRAARDLALQVFGITTKFESAQDSPSHSPERSTCPAGWIVETACL